MEFVKGRSELDPTSDSISDALEIAQHHDGLAGTEMQHVSDDYAKWLYIGYKEVCIGSLMQLYSLMLPTISSNLPNISCRLRSLFQVQSLTLQGQVVEVQKQSLNRHQPLCYIISLSLFWFEYKFSFLIHPFNNSFLTSFFLSVVSFLLQCPLLSISYCPPSEIDLSQGKKLV